MPDDVDPRAFEAAEAAAFDDDAVPLRTLPDDRSIADDGSETAATIDAAAEDDDRDDDDDDEVIVLSWYQRPVNVLTLVVAIALIGGMVGWLIADARSDRRGSEVDVGFLQDMRTHHEQAVQMAFTYLGLPDTNPGLQTVARTILVGQEIEIGRMIQMLRDMHAPEAAETDQAMAWMGMQMPASEMPGMATDAQLRQLSNSTGRDADELFVQLMTAHHKGGIAMAQDAAARAKTAMVRSFAQSIVTGQQSDIVEMQQLLT
jgi:uncharacterized protein (DUF305 family)